MAFERPRLGHSSSYKPNDYNQFLPALRQCSDSNLSESEITYPRSSKKLHSSTNPSSNLVISVVEDDPKILVNILNTLDRLFQTSIKDDDLFKNKNIHCVWATNTTDHNKEFSTLTDSMQGSIDSLAILDGNSSKNESAETTRNETGHGVLDFLLTREKQGLIRNVFAQFQSSQPHWVVDEAYKYEKKKSRLDQKIPFELKTVYKELELLHLNPGYSGVYRRFKIVDEDDSSLLVPSSFMENDEKRLTSHFYQFFKTKDAEAGRFFTADTIKRFHFEEQINEEVAGDIVGGLYSLFDMPQGHKALDRCDMALVQKAPSLLKERFKPLVQWMLSNISDIMNIFDSKRKILVTNKMSGNVDTWMKLLLKVTTQLVDS